MRSRRSSGRPRAASPASPARLAQLAPLAVRAPRVHREPVPSGAGSRAVRRRRPAVIRPATIDDVPVLVDLIVELATYEREPEQAQATIEQLESALFAPEPAVHCLIAEDPTEGVVGFALWFRTFSTWLGRHGISLEALFPRPAARRAGHGRALLGELARIAVERGYGRVEWAVLNWNTEAQNFYTSIGAEPMQDWSTWRLTGEALPALGRTSTPRVK